mgnify:CR=1 FL=1
MAFCRSSTEAEAAPPALGIVVLGINWEQMFTTRVHNHKCVKGVGTGVCVEAVFWALLVFLAHLAPRWPVVGGCLQVCIERATPWRLISKPYIALPLKLTSKFASKQYIFIICLDTAFVASRGDVAIFHPGHERPLIGQLASFPASDWLFDLAPTDSSSRCQTHYASKYLPCWSSDEETWL